MYQIALCDDEKTELDKTQAMLADNKKKHTEHEIASECFLDTEQLLERIREHGYLPDILLLDIYMPHKTGIYVAKELRRLGNECRIIFLTSSTEHALEAFGVNASQYLVKPIVKKRLFAALDGLMEEIAENRRRYLLLRIDGRLRRILVDHIVSCEAQGKRQCLHLADGSQEVLRMTINQLSEMLSGYEEFVKVGASYIVSLAHIDSLNAHDVCLDNGTSIYLPRGAYQPLRDKYFAYYCGGGRSRR